MRPPFKLRLRTGAFHSADGYCMGSEVSVGLGVGSSVLNPSRSKSSGIANNIRDSGGLSHSSTQVTIDRHISLFEGDLDETLRQAVGA